MLLNPPEIVVLMEIRARSIRLSARSQNQVTVRLVRMR